MEKAAVMADDHALTHRVSSKSCNPQQKRYYGSGLVSKVEPLKPMSCGHCGKPGHIITNCYKLGGKTPCEHCGKFNHKSEDC